MPGKVKQKRAAIWSIAIFLILMVGMTLLAASFRAYFHQVLVLPIVRLWGQLQGVLNSLHQQTIWFFWLLVILLGMSFSLWRLRQPAPEPEPEESFPTADGRLQYWNNQVILLTQGSSPSPFARKAVQQLVLEMATQGRGEGERAQLEQLPPAIQAALQFEARPRSRFRGLQIWLADTFHLKFLIRRYLAPDVDRLHRLNEILTYLDEQMEVK